MAPVVDSKDQSKQMLIDDVQKFRMKTTDYSIPSDDNVGVNGRHRQS
jgi:hypothetical protein